MVAALKYAQERGATLIQHGTTHQFKNVQNPYSGVTAEDFEFYRAGCTTTATAPYTYIPCQTDTHVTLAGSIGTDSVAGWRERVAYGRDLFTAAGLEAPTIFETPHYAATERAHAAMREVFDVRYERMEFPSGVLTGKPSNGARSLGLFFPYSTTDFTGAKVLPENLGNYAPTSFSGHAARGVDELVANARANTVVRESTASFFFHPYLDKNKLGEIIDGIEAEGYTFVPATQLK